MSSKSASHFKPVLMSIHEDINELERLSRTPSASRESIRYRLQKMQSTLRDLINDLSFRQAYRDWHFLINSYHKVCHLLRDFE